ncbi:MAG TPA: hypothetical protein VK905_06475 [Bacillota bacterium]|nr:hypothetical protein [Bacillota bacterium]
MNRNVRDMIKFYAPLAATSVLMMSSHSIVSAGLARTAEANAALAAYAVAQSIAVMFEGPCYAMQRMGVALFRDKTSYNSVRRTMLLFWAGLTALMLLVAFTPLGRHVFMGVLGVPENIFPSAIGAFRVFLLFPAASALRSFYQAIIVVNRKTGLLTINVVIRLSVMFLLSMLLPRIESLPGASVGAIVLSLGVLVEAAMAFLTGGRLAAKLPDKNPANAAVNVPGAIRFFIPIFLATVAWTFTRPVLNAALARTAAPELALATYQVAWSFSFTFTAVVFNLHQLAIIFGQEIEQRREAMRFAMLVGLGGALALSAVTFTPAGTFLLTQVIGAEAELAREAIKTIAIFCLLPVFAAATEFASGVLMVAAKTQYLTIGKLLNMSMIILIATITTTAFPTLGAQIAAMAMVGGSVTESVFLSLLSRKPYKTFMPPTIIED